MSIIPVEPLREGDWREHARCAGHYEPFFAPFGERPPSRDRREQVAKALCRQCPVAAECLQWALLTEQRDGIWGGLNEYERRQLKRRRPT
ncbi:WhiB family transcriptional regulator [Candidatus Saccharibacteria bacterium]|nr:MAG: WhiB family transcriptional regulator [Candidatus Saccharibacteria bacterium]